MNVNESHPIKVNGQDLYTVQGSTLANLATLFKGALQSWPGAILKITGSTTTAGKIQDRLERTLGIPKGKIQIVPGSSYWDDSVNVVIVFYKGAPPIVKPTEQDDWISKIGKIIVAQVEVDVAENGVQFQNQRQIPVSSKRKVIWELKFTVEQNGIREVATDFEFFKQKLFNLARKGSRVQAFI